MYDERDGKEEGEDERDGREKEDEWDGENLITQ